MLAVRTSTSFVTKRFISAAPKASTGIEHAEKFNQIGKRHEQDSKNYKCCEYHHFNTFSFYNLENEMKTFRVPQPTNKKPDVQPFVKQ